jgi:hypothetical protein
MTNNRLKNRLSEIYLQHFKDVGEINLCKIKIKAYRFTFCSCSIDLTGGIIVDAWSDRLLS